MNVDLYHQHIQLKSLLRIINHSKMLSLLKATDPVTSAKVENNKEGLFCEVNKNLKLLVP